MLKRAIKEIRKEQSVTIIVPTYNEAENIPDLIKRLKPYVNTSDILIVDDNSHDKTVSIAQSLGCNTLVRTSNRGLSASVIDGIKQVNSKNIIVMDADLQHPPETIPKLLNALDKSDFVIASRYVKGGSCAEWSFSRKVISYIANLIAKPLTRVHDIMSGFFAFKREQAPTDLSILNNKGFKIMLELLLKGNWNSIEEIPFTFNIRTKGQTKMKFSQIKDYIIQLIQLYLYKWRWIRFGLIGLIGTLIYFPILYFLTEYTILPYIVSSIIGIVCASTNNYFLNHFWTFKQKRVSHNHFLGWIKYQLMSGVTDGIYLGTLALLTEIGGLWYMSSAAIAMIAIFILKYLVASHWIWNKSKIKEAYGAS